MEIGAKYQGDVKCSSSVCAPISDDITLVIIRPETTAVNSKKNYQIHWIFEENDLFTGTKYFLRLELDRPDPASFSQPEGVHNPSQVVDHEYLWHDHFWQGTPQGQGCELWDSSFVDPDNRRLVDFERRAKHLEEFMHIGETVILSLVGELLAAKEDGRRKFFLIYKSLQARRENPELFTRGSYEILKSEGLRPENVIAFVRQHNDMWAIAITPRLTTAPVGEGDYPLGMRVWGYDRIPLFSRSLRWWRNAIIGQLQKAGGLLYIGDVLQHFPVALRSGREGR